jgi:hypothetical protein
MKTKNLLFGTIVTLLFFISCDSNDTAADTSAITNDEVVANYTFDAVTDDIALIADDQYEVNEGTTTGKTMGKTTNNYNTILPDCATISDLGSTDLVRKITITFGSATTSCVFRGRLLKGQVILTRTRGTSFPKIMTITYNNFYSSENKLEGTLTWTRTMVGDGVTLRPKTTYSSTGMTLTTSKGVYTRSGQVTREMTAGFSTRLNPTDDVYSIYGTNTTTNPKGTVYTSSIESTTPVVYKSACSLSQTPMPYPVAGILKITKNNHFATINFGAGDCDNLAMLSIDGGTATQITLGK